MDARLRRESWQVYSSINNALLHFRDRENRKVRKKSENNKKFGKITAYAKGTKNGGKICVCTFGAKIETKAFSRQTRLLLPAI